MNVVRRVHDREEVVDALRHFLTNGVYEFIFTITLYNDDVHAVMVDANYTHDDGFLIHADVQRIIAECGITRNDSTCAYDTKKTIALLTRQNKITSLLDS